VAESTGSDVARVTVGRIVRPQGNRGQVVVAPDTDFGSERFVPGAAFHGAGPDGARRLVVTESRPHDARWVIGFEGVSTIDDAEALRGIELQVPEADLTPLEAGQYYLHDLVGCEVHADSDGPIGVVVRVDLGTGTPVLVVEHGTFGEVLVPLAEEICRRIDVAARRIDIAPPAGLVELNAPRKAGGQAGEDRRRHHLPAHGRGRARRGRAGPGS
jgi:16S rRNA processing protein RimM